MRRKLNLLFLILFPAAIAAGYWLVREGGGLWLVAAGLVVVATGAFVLFAFLERRGERLKEQHFVDDVVKLDEAFVRAADPRRRQEAKELQDHWRESVEALRKSRLRRRFGNPLYALPWYMVIGESGSGKTTAIKNSSLHSPVSHLTRTAGISATRTCDWWFFEEAIILDTAGRYTIPEDLDRDEAEWERFLALLAAYRKQEPINGVVATIAADKLLKGDRPVLREDGQSIRRRIDQLMTVTGARFPVYVLVTKMDMVYGFTDTFLRLTDEEAWQAAGYLDREGDLRPQGVMEATFRTMKERLARLRLDWVHSEGDPNPGVLLLENQFSRLRPGLAEFVKAIFGENPYQEKPLLRGVFFSSGRQTARPIPPFSNPPFLYEEPASASTEDRGLFLRDLFAKILPHDRYLYTPISRLVRYRWALRRMGFVACLAILFALCGLLSLSFVRNLAAVTAFTTEFPRAPTIGVDTATNLLLLQGMRSRILDLEQANRGWLLPRFGLRGSLAMEARAKRDYVSLYEGAFQAPFDLELQKRVSAIGADTDDEIVASYSAYILARLRLLDALQKSRTSFRAHDTAGESGDFARTCTLVVGSQFPTLPPAIVATVPPDYESYLAWDEKPGETRRAAELLQNALTGLQRRHPDLAWVATEPVVDSPAVKPADFWEGSPRVRLADISVPGAYTAQGQRRIQAFLGALSDACPKARPPVDAFWRQYRREYYQAWYKFCAQFAAIASPLEGPSARETMSLLATDENPYWRLIHRAAAELAPPQAFADPPAWVQLLATLDAAIRFSQEGEAKRGPGAAKKGLAVPEDAKEKLLREIREVAPVAENDRSDSEAREKLEPMVRVVREYRRDMALIAPIAASRENAFRMISGAFSEQPVPPDPKSPLHAAYGRLISLKELVKNGASSKEGDTVWQLFSLPLASLLSYGASVACSVIEEHWEKDIWAKADNVLADARPRLLFDKTDGLVPRFREGWANPFLASRSSVLVPRKIYEKTPFEQSIGFEPQFLSFLAKGETAAATENIPRTITRCGR